ncbi:hypothetical protein C4573_04975 [Candidatus Woesearchaeota archaeon]|nr:MAG: hypothetical protein C4573_04975 [Candidatus Woesearchaeota archaeon]
MRKQKKNRTALWMGLFVVFIMVASTFAFIYSYNADTTLTYNGIKFKQDVQTGAYSAKIDKQLYQFFYHPTAVESFALDAAAIPALKNAQAIAVTFDPNANQQQLLYVDGFRFELEKYVNKQVYSAVINESSIYPFAVFTCDNATAQIPVIYLNDSFEPSFIYENNCLIVNAKGIDLLAMRDRVLYGYLGVING